MGKNNASTLIIVKNVNILYDISKLGLANVLFRFFFFRLFRVTIPVAYGGSPARSSIRTVAASLCHSHCNPGFEPLLCLHHNSRQCWILNPLSNVRDWTCVLMDTIQVCYLWAITGTPNLFRSFYICILFFIKYCYLLLE